MFGERDHELGAVAGVELGEEIADVRFERLD
jgi:hypothetical protein